MAEEEIAGTRADVDARSDASANFCHEIVIDKGCMAGGVTEPRACAGVQGVSLRWGQVRDLRRRGRGWEDDPADQRVQRTVVQAIVVHSDGGTQLGDKTEPTRGVAAPEYQADMDDKPMFPNVCVRGGHVGMIAATVKRGVDVVLVEEDVV